MFAACVLLSVVVALLRGGRLHGLWHLPFRWEGLVLAAFALRFGLHLAGLRGHELASGMVWAVQAAAYGLLVVVTWINRSVPGIPTLGAGITANAAVILINGGRMPVSSTAAEAIGRSAEFARLLEGGSYLHTALVADARLAFLADVFATPSWLPIRTVFSLGDVLILAGVFVLVQHLMLRPLGMVPAGAGMA